LTSLSTVTVIVVPSTPGCSSTHSFLFYFLGRSKQVDQKGGIL